MMTNILKKYPLLTPMIWVLVFQAISSTIGIATQPGVDGWYANAEQPWFTPPNFVFPIVWSILYVLIALTGYRLWTNRETKGGKINLGLFVAYIALNWSWSFLFFSMEMVALAAVWIMVMNILNAIIILRVLRHDKPTAFLMIPPLMWTAFAFILNFSYV